MSEHKDGFLSSDEICKMYKISPFTLRTWRRGWYTGSDGQHYFFEDHMNLKHFWCETDRRYEYDPIKLAQWYLRLSRKKHENAIAKGKLRYQNVSPEKVKSLVALGLTYQEVAEKYGVTKQRIHQIVKNYDSHK